MRAIELRLGEKGKQVLVSPMAVDDNDFLAAIARHFIGGFLEQFELEFHTVRDGSRFMLGFENLAEVVLRKNEGVLLLRCLQRRVAHVQKIRAKRQMRSVFFQDAERQQTRAFGKLNGIAKLRGSQLFPFHGKFGLSVDRTSSNERYKQRTNSRALH